MELKLFRAFVTVAEDLHFGRAAVRLGISQPQLSLQIQSLEAMLGAKLFDRNRRHVALTDIGRQFLPEASATLTQAERARRTVERAARGEFGHITIGFTGSAPLNEALPRIIGEFRRLWPQVGLSLGEMSTTDQMRALREGTLDIGFVRPGPSVDAQGIEMRPLLIEPLVAVLPSHHPLADRLALSVADLADDPFIMHPRERGPGLFDKVIDLCAAAGFRPKVDVVANQMSSIVSLVAAGLGVSVVPQALRNIHIEGARLVGLTDPDATMALTIAHRRGDDRPVLRHFLTVASPMRADPGSKSADEKPPETP